MKATDEEIRQAQEFLVKRLKAERSAVSALDSLLLSASRRIINIARKYNIPPAEFRFSANPSLQAEVKEVLSLLRRAIFSVTKVRNTFEDEDGGEPFVAPALTEENHDKTFKQRLADYVRHWGFELEATIAAAGLEGIRDAKVIEEGVKTYLDDPYDNPWIKEHRGEGEASRLKAMPHFGKGKPIDSRAALALLVTAVTAKGWSQNWMRINKGKKGYIVLRGSSFPCEICDAQVGIVHDISDTMGAPPFHPNCKCYQVFIDSI